MKSSSKTGKRIEKISRHLCTSSAVKSRGSEPVEEKKDVVIIGMGYWNRYPGCACDISSYQYSYSFSKQVEQEWVWKNRYATQPEILAYASHVADRFNLRSDTLFNTKVISSVYDEGRQRWIVKTDHNDQIEAKFLFLANGCLSSPATPGISITDEFKGSCFHTHNWNDSIDLRGKKVGIIGTGSTAVQVIPKIAKEVNQLYVFQRTPAWCAPRKDRKITTEEEKEIKKDYAAFRGIKTVESGGNLGGNAGLADIEAEAEPGGKTQEYIWWRKSLNKVARSIESSSIDEQKLAKEAGGFGVAFAFGASEDEEGGNSSFGPLSSMKVNDRLRKYLSEKIKKEVKDPEVAKLLTPKYPVACKRLCITDDYWKTFNQDNVSLIDLGGKSVSRIGRGGPYDMSNKPLFKEEVDVLIFATGFNAMTGAADGQIGELRGINGISLGQKYKENGIETYLGMMTNGFPNCFFMVGPQSASVLGNMINEGEKQADWLVSLLKAMREGNFESVDVKRSAEVEWADLCKQTTKKTVWGGVGGGCRSWYNKANIATRDENDDLVDLKDNVTGGGDVLPYTGGEVKYAQLCQDYRFSGLVFS